MSKIVKTSFMVVLLLIGQNLFAQNYTGVTDTFPGCATSGCHDIAGRDQVPQWLGTAHAVAFDSASGFVQQSSRCLQCHTTGWDADMNIGGASDFVSVDTTKTTLNVTVLDSAGFAAKVNVQCESCHGPVEFGKNHPPGVTITAETCGSCHQDEHHPYIEEWSESAHSGSHSHPVAFLQDRFRNNTECAGCHTMQGFIQFVGTTTADTANIIPEIAEAPGDAAMPIDCSTCHDPHDAKHAGQLRLAAKDLCIKCHNPEDAMPPDTPHHATSSMWFGNGAAEFEGFTYRRQSVHQLFGATAEERCVACHVFMTPFQSGPPVVPAATGHTFEPKMEACMQAGCHVDGLNDTGDREFNHRNRQAFTDSLLNELEALLESASSADSAKPEFAQGLFNLQFVQSSGSHGVHNPFYAEDILVNTLQHLRNVTVGVEPVTASTVPEEFGLEQNYPNPFNPQTTIRFDIARTTQAELDIYNSLGQHVTSLVNETLQPKTYEIRFNAAGLPSGVYFYRLRTDHFHAIRKMVLMR